MTDRVEILWNEIYVAQKTILCRNKKFDVVQKVIWCRQKQVGVIQKSVSCQQK